MKDRFGEQGHKDPMSELLALKQTGTISTYHDQFEFLLGRVNISESYAVSFFINGLKPAIQNQVKMFMPKTLNQAFNLAKLQETSLKTLQQELGTTKKPPVPTNLYQSKFHPRTTPILPQPNSNNSFPVTKNVASSSNSTRMRSSNDFDDRRARGLCFWCDEKYTVGHNCRRKQLYLVEVKEDSEEERD